VSIELQCCQCHCSFSAGSEIDRMAEIGPWGSLGDGETLEDSLHAELCKRGTMRCPECGAAVVMREEELNDLAQQLLVQW
jgi:hypothetical protein